MRGGIAKFGRTGEGGSFFLAEVGIDRHDAPHTPPANSHRVGGARTALDRRYPARPGDIWRCLPNYRGIGAARLPHALSIQSQFLSNGEAAMFLNLAPSILEKLRVIGGGP